MKRLIPLIVLLLSLACALPDITINPTPEPGENAPPASPTPIEPVTQPVIPTETSPVLPVAQPALATPIAIGILKEDGALLVILSPDKQVMGEIRTEGLENAEPGRAHFAGKWSAGRPPLVFFTFANGGQVLVNTDGQTGLLANTPMFIRLAGATGEPVIAYSTGEFSQLGLFSQLFVSPMDTLSSAVAVASLDDPESRAIYPLAIRTQADSPTGVWYTLRPWGIGGDIVFDPSDGLYYADLGNGTILNYQEHVQRNTSLSPDHAWAASEAGDPGTTTFRIYNLETGEEHDFPLLPDSDRGAGYGVFSPSSQHVAWMEGSGWRMADIPNFHATIRVATTGGDSLIDFHDTTLATLLEMPVTWVQPLGWLNDRLLVLQIHGATWEDALVVLLDVTNNQVTQLSSGTFVEFVYP